MAGNPTNQSEQVALSIQGHNNGINGDSTEEEGTSFEGNSTEVILHKWCWQGTSAVLNWIIWILNPIWKGIVCLSVGIIFIVCLANCLSLGKKSGATSGMREPGRNEHHTSNGKDATVVEIISVQNNNLAMGHLDLTQNGSRSPAVDKDSG